MVDCPQNLVQINANASVRIGDTIITTPQILSINVNRSRGKPISTASVQFLYDREQEDLTGNSRIDIRIMGSVVFTGFIKKMSVSSSFRVAGEIVIRIQAEDILHRLQNKRFTRRQKSNGLGPIVFITSIYKRPSLGFDDPTDIYDIESGSSPVEVLVSSPNMATQVQFVKGGETNTIGSLHPLTKIADPFKDVGGAGGTGGGFILHDHTSLDTTGSHSGGPAAAVFGIR